MSKFVKQALQNQFESKIKDEGISDFLVVETKGIGGIDNNVMRGELKAKGIGLSVVKNSLFCKALDNAGLSEAVGLFEGPCAVVYGGESIVDVAKEISEWGKKLKVVKIKGAFVEGESLDTEGANALSKMKTRVEMLGEVVMLMLSPGRQVAGAIAGPGGKVAGCVKAISEDDKEAA